MSREPYNLKVSINYSKKVKYKIRLQWYWNKKWFTCMYRDDMKDHWAWWVKYILLKCVVLVQMGNLVTCIDDKRCNQSCIMALHDRESINYFKLQVLILGIINFMKCYCLKKKRSVEVFTKVLSFFICRIKFNLVKWKYVLFRTFST